MMSSASREKVTVGLPVVAEYEKLKLAVRSVFAQTHTDWRLIVACDGSPERVVDLVKSITDPRVEVIADGMSLGLAARLNQISSAACTDVIARMDADDVMHPERLRRQLELLSTSPAIDIVATRSWVIDDSDFVRGLNKDPGVPETPAGHLGVTAICHPSVAFRRSWSLANPYSDKWLRTEDKELWLRSSASSQFFRIDEPLLFYRISETFDAKKQRMTYRFDRKLIRRYWKHVGATRWQWLVHDMRLRVRQVLLPITSIFPKLTPAYGRKFISVPDQDIDQAEQILRLVKETKVPGWEETP